MIADAAGSIAVIFISQRRAGNDAAYAEASDRMGQRAAEMDGYLGIRSTRGADGVGITVSYWRDADAAQAWKADAEHEAVRNLGREHWYESYEIYVAEVKRAYGWSVDGV